MKKLFVLFCFLFLNSTSYGFILEAVPSNSTSLSYITIIKAWRHGETDANKIGLSAGGGSDTPLNDEGRRQAKELGELLCHNEVFSAIYSSDLIRALDTAEEVLNAFKSKGRIIELRKSMQLREVLNGKFELFNKNLRNKASEILFLKMLEDDERGETSEKELSDKFRFWKIHPLATKEEIVLEDIIDVGDYIQRGEDRPETAYQLWQRIRQEFIRIAQENPGAIVGISTHGGVLTTLIDGLNSIPKGKYLPPYYQRKEIKKGNEVIIPTATHIENCALIQFKYDSRTEQLELYFPEAEECQDGMAITLPQRQKSL